MIRFSEDRSDTTDSASLQHVGHETSQVVRCSTISTSHLGYVHRVVDKVAKGRPAWGTLLGIVAESLR